MNLELSRWQAVLNRTDDDTFFYGVRTTGVFCRPDCRSRRPRPENVQFFARPDEARRAGFRACKRCRPEQERLKHGRAVEALRALSEEGATVGSAARAIGAGRSTVKRQLGRLGLSASDVAQSQKVERFKRALEHGSDVTSAVYEAGFGSSRAFYEGPAQALGLSPQAMKKGGAGERIAFAVAPSKFGPVLLGATKRGVCTVQFGEEGVLRKELARLFPKAERVESLAEVTPWLKKLLSHLDDFSLPLDWPLDVRATAFQARVWKAVREIRAGQTESYAALAKRLGQPSAVRAVARAVASNPLALVVPCHRVVGSDGSLTGYRWGMERKAALLEAESKPGSDLAKPRR